MRNAFAILLLLVGVQESALAANDLACDGGPRNGRIVDAENSDLKFDPPESNGPTWIDIGFQVFAISDIDMIASRFRVEGYGDFRWCDPRQAFDEAEEGRKSRVYFDKEPEEDDLWIPDVSISNTIGATELTQRRVEVNSDGTIRISVFFNAVVAARFDLKQFPFDEQSLTVAMESFSFNRDVVKLRPIPSNVGYDEDIFLPEWQVKNVVSSTIEKSDVRDRVPFSRALFTVNVARETGYYVMKLSVPLLLIVMLSWTVFWMKDEGLGGRMRISSTAFLTIVAYQFAISGNLPKVAYLTLMDRLMIASFILIALSALENMFAELSKERYPETSRRIDLNARWFFPLAYVTVIAAVANLSR